MDPFIGQIMLFGGNFPPRGWAFCDGQLLSIAQNTALFSVLGTTYGGNGTTNFGLPDLRGRVAIGQGAGPGLSSYGIGATGGAETQTLTVNQIPAHNHQVSLGPAVPTGASASNDVKTLGTGGGVGQTTNTGASEPHENRQPYIALNYIIALQGVFPSRW